MPALIDRRGFGIEGVRFGVQGLGFWGLGFWGAVTLDNAAAALTVLPTASGAVHMQGSGFRV